MRKFLITAELKDLEKQVSLGKISYSKMVEALCEKAETHLVKFYEYLENQGKFPNSAGYGKTYVDRFYENYKGYKSEFNIVKEWEEFKEIYLGGSSIKEVIFNNENKKWTIKYNYEVKDDEFESLQDLIKFCNADQFGG
jgi:hypothetical protein